MDARSSPAPRGTARLAVRDLRTIIGQDLAAMSEGERLGLGRVLSRMAVHARWRAVPIWRIAQATLHGRWTKPVALFLTDRILAGSGAELQPGSRIGPGVILKHTTGLVVGGEVTAGARLTLHQNVTLGDRHPGSGQPSLGDDVTVGAGACVLGPVRVGDRVVIAANSVVLDDVPSDAVMAGAPARVVHRTTATQEVQHADH